MEKKQRVADRAKKKPSERERWIRKIRNLARSEDLDPLLDYAFKSFPPLMTNSKHEWGIQAAYCSLLINPDFHRCDAKVPLLERPTFTPGCYAMYFELPEHLLDENHPYWQPMHEAQQCWVAASDLKAKRSFDPEREPGSYVLSRLLEQANDGEEMLQQISSYDPFREYVFVFIFSTPRHTVVPVVRKCQFRRGDNGTDTCALLSWLYRCAETEREWLFHPPTESILISADRPASHSPDLSWLPREIPCAQVVARQRTPRAELLVPCPNCGVVFWRRGNIEARCASWLRHQADRVELDDLTEISDVAPLACLSTKRSRTVKAQVKRLMADPRCHAIRTQSGILAPRDIDALEWKKECFNNMSQKCGSSQWVAQWLASLYPAISKVSGKKSRKKPIKVQEV